MIDVLRETRNESLQLANRRKIAKSLTTKELWSMFDFRRSSVFSALLFAIVSAIGRRWGGIPPRRWTHGLALRAFSSFDPSQTRWCRDNIGLLYNVNPYFFIDYHLIAFGSFGNQVREAMARFITPGMICVDVGANIGTTALPMALLAAPGGHVFAFEPMAYLADRLREHVRANLLSGAITVVESALGDKSTEIEMPAANWLTRNHGTGSVAVGSAELRDTHGVRMRSLDDFVLEYSIQRVDFIKVDIQGAEVLFLSGAKKSIQKWRPTLVMEFSPDDLALFGSTTQDLYRQIVDLGYDLHRLGPQGAPIQKLSESDVHVRFDAAGVLCIPRSTSSTAMKDLACN